MGLRSHKHMYKVTTKKNKVYKIKDRIVANKIYKRIGIALEFDKRY